MKKIIPIVLALAFSAVIVFVLPNYLTEAQNVDIAHTNEVSIVDQDILGYGQDKHSYHKLYYQGQLVGVIQDMYAFDDVVEKEYIKYKEEFPGTSLGLVEDLYFSEETSNIIFEDCDVAIAQYLIDHELLGIKTIAVEFSTEEGIYDIIYVNSKDLFTEARNQFLLNFVSQDTITKLSNNETISSPSDFGSVETNLKVEETINFAEAIVSPNKIFNSVSEIYNYLCYGRNEDRQYYETKEGDTVQAVGYYFGDMTATQVKMLNPDVLIDENQVLAPGTKLNVTYYTSPITVEVTKERLAQETVLPDSPLYVEDDTLKQGTRIIDREESNGVRNVLYQETWVNGVIQDGVEISSSTQIEPVQGIIRVGTMVPPDVGTGNWGWPVNNPIITCGYTCYFNHGGVDFQNMYSKYDVVLAADTGVVEGVGYTDIGGYYVRINHNNGYVTYYGHMRTYPYVTVGQVVERGDVLGPIGMTGVATGPHVHFAMYINNTLINACTVMNCSLIPWS